MKPVSDNHIRTHEKAADSQGGSIRIVMAILVSFLLGVAVTAFWFHHAAINAAAAARQSVAQTAIPPSTSEPVGVPAPVPTPAATPQPANPQSVNPAVIEQVKETVPNYASISLNDAEQILRETALKEFADATTESDDAVKRAQQQLEDAQHSGSAADQQAAMKHLQDTQAAAADKLKQIAANLQQKIAALKSLKNAP
jgi:hypothetical protein